MDCARGALLIRQGKSASRAWAGRQARIRYAPACCLAEVDSDEDIAAGRVPGAKAAAVRKLHQELGIEPGQVPAQDFTFLTRLHYCAPDSGARRRAAARAQLPWGCLPPPTLALPCLRVPLPAPAAAFLPASLAIARSCRPPCPVGTWGPAAEWGEHEVDYILLAQADVDLAPNPDEVMVSLRAAAHSTTQHSAAQLGSPAPTHGALAGPAAS